MTCPPPELTLGRLVRLAAALALAGVLAFAAVVAGLAAALALARVLAFAIVLAGIHVGGALAEPLEPS